MTAPTEQAELAQVPVIRQGALCSVFDGTDTLTNVPYLLGPAKREERERGRAGLRVKSVQQEFLFVTEDLPDGEPDESWTVSIGKHVFRVTPKDNKTFARTPYEHLTWLFAERVE